MRSEKPQSDFDALTPQTAEQWQALRVRAFADEVRFGNSVQRLFEAELMRLDQAEARKPVNATTVRELLGVKPKAEAVDWDAAGVYRACDMATMPSIQVIDELVPSLDREMHERISQAVSSQAKLWRFNPCPPVEREDETV